MDNKPRSVINLLRGWPSTSLLPAGLIRDAANAVLSDPTISNPGLLYGPDEGYQPCREAIAQWLTSFHQPEHPITPDRLCITGGASQNLGVMMGVYSDPHYTRNIWIVTPAYMLTFRMFEDAGFHHRMRAVPEDEEGIDIEYLRREICKSEEEAQRRGNTSPEYKPRRDRAKVYRHVIYCVPNFSNPSSRTMTLSRRRALVKLAREYDALITCDDVYDLLQWPASANAGASGITLDSMKTAHLPRLVDIDRELDGGAEREGADGFGNVQSNGTCSKIAGPGLRTGWVEGTPKFVYGLSQAGVQRSGGAPSQLTSTYITRLLQEGKLQNHIATTLRPAYASRYQTMTRAIEEHLVPLGFVAPQANREVVGGYFIWLELPRHLRGTALATRCQQEEGLIIAPGKIFEVPGDAAVQCDGNIRLCFAWEDEPLLSEGVRRIADVARRMLAAKHGDGVGGGVEVETDTAAMLRTFR